MESMKSAEKRPSNVRTARTTQERRIFGDLFLARLRRVHEQQAMYGNELTDEARSSDRPGSVFDLLGLH